MLSKRGRVLAFVWLLYLCAAVEVVLGLAWSAQGEPIPAAVFLLAAAFTAVLAHRFWLGFLRRGPDHPAYSSRAFWRRLRRRR